MKESNRVRQRQCTSPYLIRLCHAWGVVESLAIRSLWSWNIATEIPPRVSSWITIDAPHGVWGLSVYHLTMAVLRSPRLMLIMSAKCMCCKTWTNTSRGFNRGIRILRMDLVIWSMFVNSSVEPKWSDCPCFGGRSPVVIYDLTFVNLTTVDIWHPTRSRPKNSVLWFEVMAGLLHMYMNNVLTAFRLFTANLRTDKSDFTTDLGINSWTFHGVGDKSTNRFTLNQS